MIGNVIVFLLVIGISYRVLDSCDSTKRKEQAVIHALKSKGISGHFRRGEFICDEVYEVITYRKRR